MGLANNEFIKAAVDALTKMLNLLNQITKGFGPWSSSALKIGLVTSALIAGNKALKIFMATMRSSNASLTTFQKTGRGLKAIFASWRQSF